MSLPRVRNFQDSRGSIYCPSEPDSAGGIEYQSRGIIRSSTDRGNGNVSATPERFYGINSNINSSCDEFPITVACSQPAEPSLLAECQQSSGSLFSVVSAPPMPVAEQTDAYKSGLPGMGALQTGITLGLPISGAPLSSAASVESAATAPPTAATTSSNTASFNSAPRRPATLPIDPPYCSTLAPPSKTLHASLLVHQISEIEEEDNENLLTVSSITARPLIAKSREIRANRQLQANGKLSSKRGGKQQQRKAQVSNNSGSSGKYMAANSSQASVDADPPDGGYGWLIVFGAFSVQFWVAGLVKSYGVLYVEISETFPNSTATVISWIPAILSALCLALAPLSSALCQRFSCRAVVFVGGIFCALGLTLSYFATSLLHLLFTFGILTGIGGGLSTTPGIVIVSQYFDKHRALANGICVSGTAAGSFILPILIKHLAENFGFHGTILILGACMLDVCLSALLYKPLEQFARDAALKGLNETVDNTEQLNDINPSTVGILTHSTYLDSCQNDLNSEYIEHLFMEETKNRLNNLYSNRHVPEKTQNFAQESDDEVKDIIGETTFIKPIKKVRSSGIMHSVEDLSTDSTWVYRKHSGSDSNRGSRRRRNVFGNDEIISKIQAHLEKPLSPPAAVSTRGLSKSMEIPTPVSNLNELKYEDHNRIRTPSNAIEMELDDEDEDDDGPRTCAERIELYLDISLLKDSTFILMCLSVTLMSVGCPYMLYYLPAHVLSIGYNKSEAGYLVATSAVLDLCGRLGLGWLSDLQLFDRKKAYVFCILGAGIAVLTLPSEKSLYMVGLSAAMYGLCLGSWYVLMPVLLADIFGTERMSSSFGLVRMFQSIGAISVPPLAGFLRDLSGSYEICFYCMGSCMVLGCLPLLVYSLLENKNERFLDDIEDDECDENSAIS